MEGCEEARLRGNNAYGREDWDIAISAYGAGISARDVAGLSPDHRLFSNRSVAYIGKYISVRSAGLNLRGLLALAINDALTVTSICPSWPKGWYRLFIAHFVDGDMRNAADVICEGLRNCPQDPDLSLAASVFLSSSDLRPFLDEISPRPGDVERISADVAFRAKDWVTAIYRYTRAIDGALQAGIAPDRRNYCNRSAAWLQVAIINDGEKAFASAIADADRCISIDSSWPKAWLRKGNAFLQDGRPGEARDVFEQGLLRCPADGELRAGLFQALKVINEEGVESDRDGDELAADFPDTSQDLDYEEYAPLPSPRVAFSAIAGEKLDFETEKSLVKVNSHHQAPGETGIKDYNFWVSPFNGRRNAVPAVMTNDLPHTDPLNDHSLSSGLKNSLPDERRVSAGLNSASVSLLDSQNKTTETLYDLLGISEKATEVEIKKAYRELARLNHPDKNQDDPEATSKFQRLADAYRVLSNPKSRALYDNYGQKVGLENGIEVVNPSTLFALVFGSDQFTKLIGELQISSLAHCVDENGNVPTAGILEQIQKDRVGKLAVQLIRIVDPWVQGRREEFLKWAVAESERLATANFGIRLLHVIGRAYSSCASVGRAALFDIGRLRILSLPSKLSCAFASSVFRTQRARTQLRATSAASRVMSKQRRVHERVLRLGRVGRALPAAEAERMAVEMAECAVDMMWRLAVVDIETTIADVVAAVLSCTDVAEPSHSLLSDRISAIQTLGRIFSSAQSTELGKG